MIQELRIETSAKNEMIDITAKINEAVKDVKEGIVVVQSMHTTAGITVNENADPDVQRDLLMKLDEMAQHREYRHAEGNSDAHLKTSLIGISQQAIIENGKLLLGTWQGIYFCEFDGPRNRVVMIKIIEK